MPDVSDFPKFPEFPDVGEAVKEFGRVVQQIVQDQRIQTVAGIASRLVAARTVAGWGGYDPVLAAVQAWELYDFVVQAGQARKEGNRDVGH